MKKPLKPLAGIPKVKVLDENGNRILTGWYICHQSKSVCISGELSEDDIHHYVAYDEFSDWGMPRNMQIVEITPPHRIEVCDGLPDFLP